MALLSLDRHDVLETIRQSDSLYEAFLRVAKLPAVGEYRTATNADRIRAMSDEELAEVIKNPCDMGLYMPNEWCKKRNCGYQCSLDWLKQEASDGEIHRPLH